MRDFKPILNQTHQWHNIFNIRRMIRLLFLANLCLLLASCSGDENSENSESAEVKQKKNVSKRDYSITNAVSYSDLFLDSNTVESYIDQNKVPDSLSRRMRSF